jgi:hypothetical protein
MYVRIGSWELWFETVPVCKPFVELDSSREEYIIGALYLSITVNRRL